MSFLQKLTSQIGPLTFRRSAPSWRFICRQPVSLQSAKVEAINTFSVLQPRTFHTSSISLAAEIKPKKKSVIANYNEKIQKLNKDRSENPDNAEEFGQQMYDAYETLMEKEVPPTIETINSMLHLCSEDGNPMDMQTFYEDMREFDVDPTPQTFEFLISGATKAMEECQQLLEQFQKDEREWKANNGKEVLAAEVVKPKKEIPAADIKTKKDAPADGKSKKEVPEGKPRK